MRVDLSTVPDTEDVLTVPEGVYDVKIIDVRDGHTRDGSDRWSMRLEVLDGEYAGKHAGWDSLNWSERGKPRVKRVLAVLGFEVDGELNLEPADLEGRRGRVAVVIEEFENAAGVIQRRLTVPYDGWAPYGGADNDVDGDVDGNVDGDGATREALMRDSPF